MVNDKDQPENGIKCLKQAQDIANQNCKLLEEAEKSSMGENDEVAGLDNYDVALAYNMATCYQRLQMLEECADYLERAIELL